MILIVIYFSFLNSISPENQLQKGELLIAQEKDKRRDLYSHHTLKNIHNKSQKGLKAFGESGKFNEDKVELWENFTKKSLVPLEVEKKFFLTRIGEESVFFNLSLRQFNSEMSGVYILEDSFKEGHFQKVIKKRKKGAYSENFIHDAEVLYELREDPEFVNLEGFYQDSEHYYMVMPRYDQDLLSYSKQLYAEGVVENWEEKREEILYLIGQLILICQTLSKKHYKHNNLKEENLLLDNRTGKLVLKGFEYAKKDVDEKMDESFIINSFLCHIVTGDPKNAEILDPEKKENFNFSTNRYIESYKGKGKFKSGIKELDKFWVKVQKKEVGIDQIKRIFMENFPKVWEKILNSQFSKEENVTNKKSELLTSRDDVSFSSLDDVSSSLLGNVSSSSLGNVSSSSLDNVSSSSLGNVSSSSLDDVSSSLLGNVSSSSLGNVSSSSLLDNVSSSLILKRRKINLNSFRAKSA